VFNYVIKQPVLKLLEAYIYLYCLKLKFYNLTIYLLILAIK
jgi:hypothetical protein